MRTISCELVRPTVRPSVRPSDRPFVLVLESV